MSEEGAGRALEAGEEEADRDDAPRADIPAALFDSGVPGVWRPVIGAGGPKLGADRARGHDGRSSAAPPAAWVSGLRREVASGRSLRAMPTPFAVIGKNPADSALVIERMLDGLQAFDPESLQVYPVQEASPAARAGECILMKPARIAPRPDWRAMVSRRIRACSAR